MRHPVQVFTPELTSGRQDPYDRCLWIIGAPGIGKTRLVLETLMNDERLKRRVLVAPTFEEGIHAIRQYAVFERFGALVLVIDDCSPHDVIDMARFVPKLGRDSTAGCIILTPRASWALPPTALDPRRRPIEPLEQEATAEIVRHEAGSWATPEGIARLAQLSEGFPWFAALVARELDQGAVMPKTVADAADLALASPREEKDRWHDQVITRARALFAIMLTEDIEWTQLTDQERKDLYQAVDVSSWDELDKGRRDCERRGLVRIRAGGKFKYVTPEILEREMVRKLLIPPPSGGPSPIGSRLRRVPQWVHAIYDRLKRIGLSLDELMRLAEDIVSQLQQAGTGLKGFGHFGVGGSALRLAAWHSHRALGLAEFDQQQLARARVWAEDSHPEVRAWAQTLVNQLLGSHEFDSAYEEHERRRFGT